MRLFALLWFALCATACNSSDKTASKATNSSQAVNDNVKAEHESASRREPAQEAQAAHEAKSAQQAEQAATPQPSLPVVDVTIHVTGNTMKFDVESITASPGQTVHVVLENDKPGTLAHNWVLVKPGTEASVAAAGLKEGEKKGYFAPGPNVLAHSDMILPGSRCEVTFEAPKTPGTYPYICTFPGHYVVMKGVLTVTS